MPLPMVHLAVAVKIKDALGIKDPPAFYLGAIAPDGIHMREGAGFEEKLRSHLGMRANRFENLGNAKALIGRGDFLAGYAVHLVTDMYWARVFDPFLERFHADNPGENHASRYYNDCDAADLGIYNTAPWTPEVFAALGEARGEAADDLLTADEVERWRVRTVEWFTQDFSHLMPVKYITQSEIDSYIEYAVKKCLEYFEKA